MKQFTPLTRTAVILFATLLSAHAALATDSLSITVGPHDDKAGGMGKITNGMADFTLTGDGGWYISKANFQPSQDGMPTLWGGPDKKGQCACGAAYKSWIWKVATIPNSDVSAVFNGLLHKCGGEGTPPPFAGKIIHVDLDADTDNTGAIECSDEEDAAEDESPGVYITVNDDYDIGDEELNDMDYYGANPDEFDGSDDELVPASLKVRKPERVEQLTFSGGGSVRYWVYIDGEWKKEPASISAPVEGSYSIMLEGLSGGGGTVTVTADTEIGSGMDEVKYSVCSLDLIGKRPEKTEEDYHTDLFLNEDFEQELNEQTGPPNNELKWHETDLSDDTWYEDKMSEILNVGLETAGIPDDTYIEFTIPSNIRLWNDNEELASGDKVKLGEIGSLRAEGILKGTGMLTAEALVSENVSIEDKFLTRTIKFDEKALTVVPETPEREVASRKLSIALNDDDDNREKGPDLEEENGPYSKEDELFKIQICAPDPKPLPEEMEYIKVLPSGGLKLWEDPLKEKPAEETYELEDLPRDLWVECISRTGLVSQKVEIKSSFVFGTTCEDEIRFTPSDIEFTECKKTGSSDEPKERKYIPIFNPHPELVITPIKEPLPVEEEAHVNVLGTWTSYIAPLQEIYVNGVKAQVEVTDLGEHELGPFKGGFLATVSLGPDTMMITATGKNAVQNIGSAETEIQVIRDETYSIDKRVPHYKGSQPSYQPSLDAYRFKMEVWDPIQKDKVELTQKVKVADNAPRLNVYHEGGGRFKSRYCYLVPTNCELPEDASDELKATRIRVDMAKEVVAEYKTESGIKNEDLAISTGIYITEAGNIARYISTYTRFGVPSREYKLLAGTPGNMTGEEFTATVTSHDAEGGKLVPPDSRYPDTEYDILLKRQSDNPKEPEFFLYKADDDESDPFAGIRTHYPLTEDLEPFDLTPQTQDMYGVYDGQFRADATNVDGIPDFTFEYNFGLEYEKYAPGELTSEALNADIVIADDIPLFNPHPVVIIKEPSESFDITQPCTIKGEVTSFTGPLTRDDVWVNGHRVTTLIPDPENVSSGEPWKATFQYKLKLVNEEREVVINTLAATARNRLGNCGTCVADLKVEFTDDGIPSIAEIQTRDIFPKREHLIDHNTVTVREERTFVRNYSFRIAGSRALYHTFFSPGALSLETEIATDQDGDGQKLTKSFELKRGFFTEPLRLIPETPDDKTSSALQAECMLGTFIICEYSDQKETGHPTGTLLTEQKYNSPLPYVYVADKDEPNDSVKYDMWVATYGLQTSKEVQANLKTRDLDWSVTARPGAQYPQTKQQVSLGRISPDPQDKRFNLYGIKKDFLADGTRFPEGKTAASYPDLVLNHGAHPGEGIQLENPEWGDNVENFLRIQAVAPMHHFPRLNAPPYHVARIDVALQGTCPAEPFNGTISLKVYDEDHALFYRKDLSIPADVVPEARDKVLLDIDELYDMEGGFYLEDVDLEAVYDSRKTLHRVCWDGRKDADGDGQQDFGPDPLWAVSGDEYRVELEIIGGEGLLTRAIVYQKLEILEPEEHIGSVPFHRYFEGEVNSYNGNLFLARSDISVADGKGILLSHDRYYNSLSWRYGLLGYGWITSYEMRCLPVYERNDNDALVRNVYLFTQSGRPVCFELDEQSGIFLAYPNGKLEKIEEPEPDCFVLTKWDGTTCTFDKNGQLVSISDRYNNTIQVEYETYEDLTLYKYPVSIDDGERSINLLFNVDASYRMLKATGMGRSIEYEYPEQPDRFIEPYQTDDTLDATLTPVDSGGMDIYNTFGYGHNASTLKQTPVEMLMVDNMSRQKVTNNPHDLELAYQYGPNDDLYTPQDEGIVNQWARGKKVVSITIPESVATKFVDGRIAEVEHTYDDNDRIKRVDDPEGRFFVYDYNANNNIIKETSPDGETQYDYDDRGNLTLVDPPLGASTRYDYSSFEEYNRVKLKTVETQPKRLTEYAYNGSGFRTSVVRHGTDTQGNNKTITVSYTPTSFGKAATMTDARGTTSFAYNANGILTSKTRNGISLFDADYDTIGIMTSSTDGNGNTTSYTYDNIGRLRFLTLPAGFGTEEFKYDALSNVITHIDNTSIPASKTVTAYDATAYIERVTQDVGGRNKVTKYETDPEGNVINETLVRDAHTEITYHHDYDRLSRRIKTTDALGHWTSQNYDPFGRIKSETDGDNNTTTYNYDQMGRVKEKILPGDFGTHSYTYDDAGNMKTHENTRKVTMVYDYDLFDRQIAQHVLNGVSGKPWAEKYDYDDLGNRISYENAREYVTVYKYDTLSRLKKAIYPPADGDTEAVYEAYTYDNARNRKTFRDRNGDITTYEYDELNRLTKTLLPDNGGTPAQTYDGKGNVQASTDAGGNTTTFKYDGLGRVTEKTLPGGPAIIYEYDNVGNIIEETDRRGTLTKYEYDHGNRLTKKTVDPAGLSIVTKYDYTDGNLLKQSEVPETPQKTVLQRDALDRVTKTTIYRTPPLAPIVVQNEYDGEGNLISSTDGETYSSFTHDELDRQTESKTGDRVTKTTLSPTGSVIQVTDNAGNRTTYTHNSREDTVLEETSFFGINYAFAYDPEGNMVSMTELARAGTPVTRFEYDALGRRTKIIDPTGKVTEFIYDNNGNLLRRTEGTESVSYLYDELNRKIAMIADGARTTYAYDKNGNLIAMISPAAREDYVYDRANRLITKEVTVNGKTAVFRYEYDKAGMRTRMTGPSGVSTYENDGTATDEILHNEHNFRLPHDEAGRSTGVKYPNEMYTSIGWNSTNEIDGINTFRINGNKEELITGFGYDRDDVGNVTDVALRHQNKLDVKYTYDSLYRLKSEVKGSKNDPLQARHYTYDASGNRTLMTDEDGQETHSTYDAANKLLSTHPVKVAAPPTRGRVYTVGDTYPTISAALNAVVADFGPGGVLTAPVIIRVKPGEYVEDVAIGPMEDFVRPTDENPFILESSVKPGRAVLTESHISIQQMQHMTLEGFVLSGEDATHGTAISVSACSDITIANNIIHDYSGAGISVESSGGVGVYHNTIDNTPLGSIQVDGGTNVQVRNNIVMNSVTATSWLDGASVDEDYNAIYNSSIEGALSVFEDGFESGDTSAWKASEGDIAVQGNTVHSGQFALQAVLDKTQDASVYRDISITRKGAIVRGWFNVADSKGDVTILQLTNSSGENIAALELSNNRIKAVYAQGGSRKVTAGTAPFLKGQWISTAIVYVMDEEQGVFLWYIDGVLTARIEGDDTEMGDTFARLTLGALSDKKNASGQIFFDGFEVQQGYTTLSSWQAAGGGENTIDNNPKLLPGYRLTSYSPCNDTGQILTSIKRDCEGTRRGILADMGAIVYLKETYNYNSAGRMTAKTLDEKLSEEYAYTDRGQLNSYTDHYDPSTDAEYTYDGDGKRVSKTVDDVTTYFLYDGPNVVAEYNANGDLLKSYIHAPGIDNPLAEIAYNGSDETWHYYLKDGQGSISAITESDALAATVAFYDYSAFGSLIPETSSPAPEADGQPTANFMYTGREYNPESGDYYFRWRTYSPTSGRFTGADPAGYTDGWNLYPSYFAGNGVDPMGLAGIIYAAARIFYGPEAAQEFETSLGKSMLGFGGEFAGGVVALGHPVATAKGTGIRVQEAGERNAKIAARNNPDAGWRLYYDAAVFCALDVVPGTKATSQQFVPVSKTGQKISSMEQAQNRLQLVALAAGLSASTTGMPVKTGSFKLMTSKQLAAIAQAEAAAKNVSFYVTPEGTAIPAEMVRANPELLKTVVAEESVYGGVRAASRYLREQGVPREVRKTILESADVRTIKLEKAGQADFGIRYYDNIRAFPKGKYLFETFPASRQSLAITRKMSYMTEFKQWQIRPGTTTISGRAASQGVGYPGGQVQKIVLHPNESLLEIR